MAAIHLQGIAKRYANGHPALRELELHVADGEFLVLVGPSGSGKSTALRIVAGLERPSAGRVWIGGRDVTDLPPQRRELAMVFQSYALYPHMTVRENLGFGLRIRRTERAEAERRIRDAAAMLGLETVLDRRPAQLSGGQRQRVALGRAIIREPRAFLFDEPLSNLDARLRTETRAELARLHRRLGTTTVYVTHDQTEAMTLGQRVAVLRDGALQQVAPPLELYRAPANRFVAGFIGTPAMNLLPGVLQRADGRWSFRGRGLEVQLPHPLPDDAAGEATLGVRPHDLRLDEAAGDGIAARVEVVEPLGSEQIVHLRTVGGERLLAAGPPEPPLRPDDTVWVTIPPHAVHLFRDGDGSRIAPVEGR